MDATATTTITAATVLTADGPRPQHRVTVADGRIAAVEPADAGAASPGSILAPGFIDLQVNGIGSVDVAGASGTDWDALDRALLAQGVTTWCPTLTSAPRAQLVAGADAVAAAAARPGGPRPQIAGVHLEGPFLSVPGAHPVRYLHATVDVDWLAALPPNVTVVTLAPELPGAEEAIGALARRGVLVSLGHSACRDDQARRAATAGARLVTHLGNAMTPLHQRRPGLLGAGLTDDRLAVALIADGVHIHPTLIRLAFAAKPAGGVVLVTDAVAADAGRVGPVVLDPAARAEGSAGGDAARLPDGTLAGSVLTMVEAVDRVGRDAGIALPDAVAAAATNPAACLGLDDRGQIAPGRRADLVELTADPLTVHRVWVGGALAYAR